MQNVSFKLKRVLTLKVLSHIFRTNVTKKKKGGTVGEKRGLTVDILNRHNQLKQEKSLISGLYFCLGHSLLEFI